ncbi:hypothetical protein DPX39_100116900 [Trypanosoma brucei equiperdum]|uniref:Uncharacterized protein n=1 Tax=Trypanosoma brucei equiperdum TaxID=630700 RepID=A0A3L6KYB7_9TRYP|nr:hypothetical protein DPX39_100116900 [Trypanosoma brucei equiperdum]
MVEGHSDTLLMVDGCTDTEKQEAQTLLLGGDSTREQLLSELSFLAETVTRVLPSAEVACNQVNLRLIVHMMEVISKYPTLGSLLVMSPRRLDEVMGEVLMNWLRHEAALVAIDKEANLLNKPCYHVVEPATRNVPTCEVRPGDANFPCMICVHTSRWSCAFWDLIRAEELKVGLHVAADGLPSFLQLQGLRSMHSRPGDGLIGSGRWWQVIGHITSIFFLHRESSDPMPIAELRTQTSNGVGVVAQQPLWLDLSFIPQLEMKETLVVGERIHAVGLVEASAIGRGTTLYSKKGPDSSPTRILLKARFVRTARFSPQWSNQQSAAEALTPPFPSARPCDGVGMAKTSEHNEVCAVYQARCCWECVAGAVTFAAAKAGGGFRGSHGRTRMEAILAALDVSALPISLWAAAGIVLASSKLQDGGVVTSVVGSADTLTPLRTFLLELGEETNFVLPVVHGLEKALLPMYARAPASHVMLPTEDGVVPHVEWVRGGTLNTAFQQVVFIPSLQAITTPALNAIQSALEQREHVVIREGGQSVKCRTASALLGMTQESTLVQQRHLFQFIDKGDFVLHVSSHSFKSPQEQAEVLFGALRGNAECDCNLTVDFFNRCENQWDVWYAWSLARSVEEPTVPQVLPQCSALLHSYFLTVKAICRDAVDVVMMSVLVKITCAHALLRHVGHPRAARRGSSSREKKTCACQVSASTGPVSTALVDAIVAIELCDASLRFMVGVSLIGGTSVFDLIVNDDGFDVMQYARDLQIHLESSMPADAK